MGCDYFADSDGVFEATIDDANGNEVHRVHLDGLKPEQPLYADDVNIADLRDVGDGVNQHDVSILRGRQR